jgi:hypothetical protein
VLGAGVRGQRHVQRQVLGPVAEHPPERHQVLVEVVDGLHLGARLGEQHGQRPGERLDVVIVRGQQVDDPVGQARLAAEVGERAPTLAHDCVPSNTG